MDAEADRLRLKVNIAHYRWALETFAREIERDFPLFRYFESGPVPRLLVFLRSLPAREQAKCATALVKRRNQEGAHSLGESCTAEERDLVEKCGRAILSPTRGEYGPPTLVRRAPKSRVDFRRSVLREIEPVLGQPYVRRAAGWWLYKTKVQGWILETEIDTAGHHHPLSYSHKLLLSSGAPVKQDFSLLSLLGISSGTSWGFDDDAALSSRGVAQYCSVYLTWAGEFLPIISTAIGG
jgi:hypothetical protein